MSLRSWNSSEEFLADYKKKYKGLKWFSLVLEALGVIVVAITAVYLRIADLHPTEASLNWKVACSDLSLTSSEPVDDNPILLYVIVIVVPALFIFILELEQSLFSTSPSFENLSRSERMCKSLPRYGSVLAMFIVGILLTSFFSDYLMIVIVRPRPYFLTLYGTNCPSAYNGTRTDEYYDALKSFPSHLAAVAAFCCMFAASHAHATRETHGTSLLLPIMSQGFVVLAVTAGLDRYTSRLNHLWDVAGGLIIGLVVAIYTSSLLCDNAPSNREKNGHWMNFWNMFIPRARVNLPPTNAEARNVMSRRT